MSELVILMIAREWSQDYEWSVHAPLAAKQGISIEIIDAIAAGRRPTKMNEDETIVFDFVDELNRNHRVSEESYGRAVRRFGEKGVVDIFSRLQTRTTQLSRAWIQAFRMPSSFPPDRREPA